QVIIERCTVEVISNLFFQYFYKYKKTRLSLQKGVFLRPSIRRIGSLTNCPFKRYSFNELFVF
ncbi:hypothetical protein, partial [Enterococcus faecalis]|uniref:hypothetical protein n=3 Tax=Enterococcus faecalis TaxID=1351 RepID=UPI0028B4FE1A